MIASVISYIKTRSRNVFLAFDLTMKAMTCVFIIYLFMQFDTCKWIHIERESLCYTELEMDATTENERNFPLGKYIVRTRYSVPFHEIQKYIFYSKIYSK